MHIVVFDPQLTKFGHHVQFNRHLLRLLSSDDNKITYLDLESQTFSESNELNVHFINLKYEQLALHDDKNIDEVDFDRALRSSGSCKKLWEYIQSLNPDIVIMASEGIHRNPLYNTIPLNLISRVYIVVHVVWSLLNTLNAIPNIKMLFQKKLGGVFVLEPFLMEAFISKGIRTFWLPHRSYSNSERIISSAYKKHDSSYLRVGTVGVINERRNHNFLIDTISSIEGLLLEYTVAGRLALSVKENIESSIKKFKNKSSCRINTKLEHLKENEFRSLLGQLDLGLLAYDQARTLQASGAVYSYIESGTPLLAPNIEIFRYYSLRWPELVQLYEAGNSLALVQALRSFNECLENNKKAFFKAQEAFLLDNDLVKHKAHISQILKHISAKNMSSSSFFRIANEKLRYKQYDEAHANYLSSISINPEFNPHYENCISLLEKMGDYLGVSKLHTLQLRNNKKLHDCGGFFLKESGTFEILVWPVFTNVDEYSDFLVRLSWHLKPIVAHIYKIHIFCREHINRFFVSNSSLSLEAIECTRFFIDKIQRHNPEEIENHRWSFIKFSFIWHYTSSEERKYPFPRTNMCASLYNKPIWRVDEKKERFASSFYLKAVSERLVDLTHSRYEAFVKFKSVCKKFKNKKIAVFGTGESLSKAMEVDFSRVDTIAANSMVKDIDLLDHLQPKLIVCADPIFHAGVSKYAEEFRKMLRYALHRYSCPLIVPERDLHIYHHYFYGEEITIIPIPFIKRDLPNYSMQHDFSVSTTGNVLTVFLLQLAFSMSNKVDIYGCDGRPLNENNYFWKHNKSAQFTEEIDDIKLAHPGFFAIDYNNYYKEHCLTLEKWLSHAEEIGKVVYSRTSSYIPALKKRESLDLGGIND